MPPATRPRRNVATYNARFYEGRAVIGHIAGKMTKTNTIGYIASFPIPEVDHGHQLGLSSTPRRPTRTIEFKVVWAFTWFDPAKEADAANALIEQGCDVHHAAHRFDRADGRSPRSRKSIAFGQASDMARFGPNACLTVDRRQLGPVLHRAGQGGDRTAPGHRTDTWDGIGEGGVVIAPISDAVPAEVKAEAEALIKSIADESYHPFTGPLNKQDGSPLLEDGEVTDDGTLAGMEFYVEGVEGDHSVLSGPVPANRKARRLRRAFRLIWIMVAGATPADHSHLKRPTQSGREGWRNIMAHIVVLGAGLGGTIMAYELADQIGKGDRITVVTKDPMYHFVPSNPGSRSAGASARTSRSTWPR